MIKNLKIQRLLGIVFLFNLLAVNVLPANLHRYHTTLTRIDYNRKENIFEISIKLVTHDLILLLEKNGKRLDLENSAVADKLIFNYLNETFVLTDKTGTIKSLRWIGKEFDADTVEVYLEADSTETLDGYKLKNVIFFDRFPEQTNIVVCRYDDKKADLLFKVGDKIKEIVEYKLISQ